MARGSSGLERASGPERILLRRLPLEVPDYLGILDLRPHQLSVVTQNEVVVGARPAIPGSIRAHPIADRRSDNLRDPLSARWALRNLH